MIRVIKELFHGLYVVDQCNFHLGTKTSLHGIRFLKYCSWINVDMKLFVFGLKIIISKSPDIVKFRLHIYYVRYFLNNKVVSFTLVAYKLSILAITFSYIYLKRCSLYAILFAKNVLVL